MTKYGPPTRNLTIGIKPHEQDTLEKLKPEEGTGYVIRPDAHTRRYLVVDRNTGKVYRSCLTEQRAKDLVRTLTERGKEAHEG